MGDTNTPKAPQLPPEAPAELRKFLACELPTVTLTNGKLTWLPLPPEIKDFVPEGVKPDLSIEPGTKPGTATIKVSLGPISISLPASITNGELNVDTSDPGMLTPQPVVDGINQTVKDLNDWFKHNGKGLAPPAFGKGQVSLSKVDLPAPAKTTAAPGPGQAPAAPPKPTPPPTPVEEKAPEPYPELKYVEPPTLPTKEVFGPGATLPKPVVGAGGPGGPKAPAGLGGLAWQWIALVLTFLVLGAIGIVLVGPALGLFGAAAPTPTATPTATPTPTPSATVVTPTPTPTPTPSPSSATVEDLRLTGGCVSVVHKPLGAYPSHLHWVLTFSGDVPEGATVRIVYREGTTGELEFEDIPIVRGVATADTGITAYGTKTILQVQVWAQELVWLELTERAKQIFGESFTVTSQEGKLAGNTDDCVTQ